MSTYVGISPESGSSSFSALEDSLAEGCVHQSYSRVYAGNAMTISKVANVFPRQIWFCEPAVHDIPVRVACLKMVEGT